MNSSVKKMLFSCVVASCVVAMAVAQKEYLPPSNKGYNYPPPSVPFPSDIAPTKQPAPTPGNYPRPQRPSSYLPPSPQPQHDHHEHHEDHVHEPGMPFDFSYAVNENGNDFSHNAISDGDVTRGEYRVALPDGRTQIVKYTADWKNGFNAEVTYEGEARYPDQPTGGYPAARPSAGPAQNYVPANQGGGYQY